ncbi:hypothetical protein NQ317_010751 [Molorchus minor]|uniref:Uncharacterized protein n=1 Tax=Molorchus minor TaxID=1323400 RepID=A0ABQ9JF75_9CUCU|nr:hypothetical protein NQ317_010751 [Molorchus minor]
MRSQIQGFNWIAAEGLEGDAVDSDVSVKLLYQNVDIGLEPIEISLLGIKLICEIKDNIGILVLFFLSYQTKRKTRIVYGHFGILVRPIIKNRMQKKVAAGGLLNVYISVIKAGTQIIF